MFTEVVNIAEHLSKFQSDFTHHIFQIANVSKTIDKNQTILHHYLTMFWRIIYRMNRVNSIISRPSIYYECVIKSILWYHHNHHKIWRTYMTDGMALNFLTIFRMSTPCNCASLFHWYMLCINCFTSNPNRHSFRVPQKIHSTSLLIHSLVS